MGMACRHFGTIRKMSTNKKVWSLVFLDAETTGLETARLTELSMVAVTTEDLEKACPNVPRVKHKLTMCLNPRKLIDPMATRVSGLDNFMLEHHKSFDLGFFTLLEGFLERLPPPVCLLAHNGLRFDFPILAREVSALGQSFSEELLCADTLLGFRQILGAPSNTAAGGARRKLDLSDGGQNSVALTQAASEDASNHGMFGHFECTDWDAAMAATADAAEAKICTSQASPSVSPKKVDPKALARTQEMTPKKQRRSFKLGDLVSDLMGPQWTPPGALHSAEGDAEALLACVATLASRFIPWVQQNAQLFPPNNGKLNKLLSGFYNNNDFPQFFYDDHSC